MIITLKTHDDLRQELETERSKVVMESIDLMRKQARSNQKYAQRMTRIHNKLLEIERKIEGVGGEKIIRDNYH